MKQHEYKLLTVRYYRLKLLYFNYKNSLENKVTCLPRHAQLSEKMKKKKQNLVEKRRKDLGNKGRSLA